MEVLMAENGNTDISEQTYDITDVQGTITIDPSLTDFITVTRYNEIEARTETTRNVDSMPIHHNSIIQIL